MDSQTDLAVGKVESVGSFLLRRLAEVGIGHVFGVAGYYNYELLDLLESSGTLEWVTCCNELNAAYAADGYARTSGAATLFTVHGVSELSALCGVAAAYAEHVPVVVISGAPPSGEMQRKALFQQATGDGITGLDFYAHQFCVAHARLTPQNAVIEIDRCIRACLLERRPVYLQLPMDIANVKIHASTVAVSADFQSDPDLLDAFIGLAIAKIRRADRCAVIVGSDVDRFGLTESVASLVSNLNIPVAVLESAKGVIDETIHQYAGVYANGISRPEVNLLIDGADCVLMLGVRLVDSVPSEFRSAPQPARQIFVGEWFSKVDDEDFSGISMSDVVSRLNGALQGEWRGRGQLSNRIRFQESRDERSSPDITSKLFWSKMGEFFKADDIILAELNEALRGILDSPLPARAKVIVQPLWGAMGFTLPAMFGSLVADPTRRHLLFITPSSLQESVQELSTILHHAMKPIIFLVTSKHAGERGRRRDRYVGRLSSWRYTELCSVFDYSSPCLTRFVRTTMELEASLALAAQSDLCSFIQVELV